MNTEVPEIDPTDLYQHLKRNEGIWAAQSGLPVEEWRRAVFGDKLIEELYADEFLRIGRVTPNPSYLGSSIKGLSPLGYHLREIQRGVFGEPSKIREETEEFIDAVDQGNPVMALVELSDLLGAIREYLRRHHSSVTLDDLTRMADATARAFQGGQRK